MSGTFSDITDKYFTNQRETRPAEYSLLPRHRYSRRPQCIPNEMAVGGIFKKRLPLVYVPLYNRRSYAARRVQWILNRDTVCGVFQSIIYSPDARCGVSWYNAETLCAFRPFKPHVRYEALTRDESRMVESTRGEYPTVRCTRSPFLMMSSSKSFVSPNCCQMILRRYSVGIYHTFIARVPREFSLGGHANPRLNYISFSPLIYFDWNRSLYPRRKSMTKRIQCAAKRCRRNEVGSSQNRQNSESLFDILDHTLLTVVTMNYYQYYYYVVSLLILLLQLLRKSVGNDSQFQQFVELQTLWRLNRFAHSVSG